MTQMPTDVPPLLFDRRLLAVRRDRAARAAQGGPGVDFLLERAIEDLVDRVDGIRRRLDTVAIVGAHAGQLGRALQRRGVHKTIIELDRSRVALERLEAGRLVVQADEEALPLKPAAFDAVLSPLVLQHVNDVPGVLAQMRMALKPDGLLLATMVGGESLAELRQAFMAAEIELESGASPRVAPFADGRDLATLLQRAGLALPVVDSDRFTVAYASPLALMAELRAMGATNALVERRRSPLRRATLMRAAEIYAERFSRPDGKVLATFELITLTAWAPDPSQPRALKPGSATTRLADALGTREQSAGD